MTPTAPSIPADEALWARIVEAYVRHKDHFVFGEFPTELYRARLSRYGRLRPLALSRDYVWRFRFSDQCINLYELCCFGEAGLAQVARVVAEFYGFIERLGVPIRGETYVPAYYAGIGEVTQVEHELCVLNAAAEDVRDSADGLYGAAALAREQGRLALAARGGADYAAEPVAPSLYFEEPTRDAARLVREVARDLGVLVVGSPDARFVERLARELEGGELEVAGPRQAYTVEIPRHETFQRYARRAGARARRSPEFLFDARRATLDRREPPTADSAAAAPLVPLDTSLSATRLLRAASAVMRWPVEATAHFGVPHDLAVALASGEDPLPAELARRTSLPAGLVRAFLERAVRAGHVTVEGGVARLVGHVEALASQAGDTATDVRAVLHHHRDVSANQRWLCAAAPGPLRRALDALGAHLVDLEARGDVLALDGTHVTFADGAALGASCSLSLSGAARLWVANVVPYRPGYLALPTSLSLEEVLAALDDEGAGLLVTGAWRAGREQLVRVVRYPELRVLFE